MGRRIGDRPVIGLGFGVLGFRVLGFRVRVMGQGPVMGRDGPNTGDGTVMRRRWTECLAIGQ